MEKKLTTRDYLSIGSLLFGLFFGAGNLIFPVHLGQEAGTNIFMANLGFLVTGIGLPFLGVIAIGISGKQGVYELAQRINKHYALIFTILLYLVMGPFFALPRLATTSYEIGIVPFLPSSTPLALALFSLAFFILSWLGARNPTNLLDYIGKFLNPLFLILLGILLAMAFITPMGDIASTPVQEAYQTFPFLTGFTQGYNTLDGLAALAYGIVIVTTIKKKGVTDTKGVAMGTIKSGAISIVLMGVIYTLLAYMGTMSLGTFALSENGSIALAQIANHYLGSFGSVLLALIVILACLKTSIGITAAFAETFTELFPRFGYQTFILIVSILPCLFANVGLTNIIAFSTPVLMFIYPLAMTLILLTLCGSLFKHHRQVYLWTTIFTLIPAIIDGLNASPAFIRQQWFVNKLIVAAENCLPFFNVGMGWVIPALIGFAVGCLLMTFSTKITKTLA